MDRNKYTLPARATGVGSQYSMADGMRDTQMTFDSVSSSQPLVMFLEGIPSISGKIPPLAPVPCVLIQGGGAAMAAGH
jgi:hypothetical protein